jgi:hypothetical protein
MGNMKKKTTLMGSFTTICVFGNNCTWIDDSIVSSVFKARGGTENLLFSDLPNLLGQRNDSSSPPWWMMAF